MNSTQNLKNDHITIRRLGKIVQTCSNKLYLDKDIPVEDIEIISVVIEEFVDKFHHAKEEQSYFPNTKYKKGYSEDIRKFLIEHELGRRIAIMLRRELNKMKFQIKQHKKGECIDSKRIKEPVARFLKSYSVYITDHTGKEDNFFSLIEKSKDISNREDMLIQKHYEFCKQSIGGEVRIKEMIKLIEYLEDRDWMKN
ncbi:MAG: hemerythrin domain-containing protein [Nitrososphaeraceae archaeon]